MRKNKIISIGLTAGILLSSATAFAAPGDIYEKSGYNIKYTALEYMKDDSAQLELMKNEEKYAWEGQNKKAYDLADVNKEFGKDKDNFAKNVEKNYEGKELEETQDPEELKVVEISAINNTSVVVNFSDVIEGEVVATDFEFDNGLKVLEADKLSGDKRVKLVTDKQVAGTTYTLIYKGEATGLNFAGVEESYVNKYKIVSAKARSNTSVTVILDDAPLAGLARADFGINGLTITDITTTENVVTLTTSPQVADRNYTVESLAGEGSATFTGKAAVKADKVIEDVKLDNYRELRVEFAEPMLWETAKDLDNYYIGLTEVERADGSIEGDGLQKVAIEKISDKWTVIPADGQILGTDGENIVTKDEDDKETKVDNAKVSSIIIRSEEDFAINGQTSTDAHEKKVRAEGGLFSVNELGTIEFRNLVRGYINTEEYEFVVRDPQAPTVVTEEITIEEGEAISFKFDEPIMQATSAAEGEQLEFNVKINGKTVVATRATDNDASKTVEEFKTFGIANHELPVGTHTMQIAGARDLANKLQEPNYSEIEITVEEKEDESTPSEAVKPIVKELKQVADNVLAIEFEKDTVETETLNGAELVIKKGQLKDKVWKDATINLSSSATANYVVDGDMAYVQLNVASSYTADIVAFQKEFYDEQNEVRRDIVLTGYKNGDKPENKGAKVEEEIIFVKDKQAPTIVRNVSFNKDELLFVEFEDKPFAKPNGEIAITTSGAITITRTDAKNKSTIANIDLAESPEYVKVKGINAKTGAIEDYDYKTSDKIGVEINLAAENSSKELLLPQMLNKDGKVVDGEVYEVKFAAGTVTDKDGEKVNDVTLSNTVDGNVNAIPETKTSIVIEKEGIVELEDEGRVPQTAPAFISSNSDNKGDKLLDEFDAVPGISDLTDTKYNQIVVIFDGEVLAETAKNPANYKLDGKRLPAGTTIKFYEETLADEDGKGISDKAFVKDMEDDSDVKNVTGYVIIDLPLGSTKVTADYKLDVEGITNRKGKTMLPVVAKANLVDDTAPVLNLVQLRGTNEVHLVFNEPIEEVTDAVLNNIKVTIDNETTTISEVGKAEGNEYTLVIRLDKKVENIEGKSVKVQIFKDKDGQVNITDGSVLENQVLPVEKTGAYNQ